MCPTTRRVPREARTPCAVALPRAAVLAPALAPSAFTTGFLLCSTAQTPTPLASRAFVLCALGMAAAAALACCTDPIATRFSCAVLALPPLASFFAVGVAFWVAPGAAPLAYCPLAWGVALHAAHEARVRVACGMPPWALFAQQALGAFAGMLASRPLASPQALKGAFVACYVLYLLGYGLALALLRAGAAKPRRHPLKIDDACAHLARVGRLTLRECEVLPYLAREADLASVARALGISVHTARVHAHNIHVRLGVSTREELVALVAQTQTGVTQAQMAAAQAAPAPRRRGRPRTLDPRK